MPTPKSLPKLKVEEFITKDGKFDSSKFWKLSDAQIADIVGDAVGNFKEGVKHGFTKETQQSMDLLEALNKENPDLGLDHYIALYKSMKLGNGSALSKDFLESLKEYDPDMFQTYLKNHRWEAYSIQPMEFNFDAYARENLSKVKDADADIRSVDPTKDSLDSAEPSIGVLTDKSLNNASPAATPPGVLTNPPLELPKKEIVIREPIDDAEMNELITKGPERTYTDRVGNTTLKPEDKPTFLTKERGSLPKEGVVVGPDTPIKPIGDSTTPVAEKPTVSPSSEVKTAAEETAKTEAATGETKATPETSEMKGVLTGKEEKPGEPSKGLFSKIGGHISRNWGKYLGGVGLGTIGWAAIRDLASDDSTLKSWFTKRNHTLDTNNPSTNQPRIKPLDQREGAYMPERLLRFRQDTQDPFISNTNVNVDAGYKPINEDTSVQQVVNASTPENNATADYVRAAYNSYIPSDAGRAYQKAIYGDPLELDRMRLQQQQQKWRDFVMRSGQSPAELVQRGLMPYDALQYV